MFCPKHTLLQPKITEKLCIMVCEKVCTIKTKTDWWLQKKKKKKICFPLPNPGLPFSALHWIALHGIRLALHKSCCHIALVMQVLSCLPCPAVWLFLFPRPCFTLPYPVYSPYNQLSTYLIHKILKPKWEQ